MRKKIGILILFLAFPLLISTKHIEPAYDRRLREALDIFANELAKKHKLHFLNSGVDFSGSSKSIWAINLVSHQTLTIEEARKLAAELSYQLLYKTYHDPLFTNYFKMDRNPNVSEMKNEYVGFRLTFWDQNTNRPLDPFVAQIRLKDGNLYYHYADPKTQVLQEPVVEPLTFLEFPNYR